MKALLFNPVNTTATLSEIPIPQPGPNELLIAVKAIALNADDALPSNPSNNPMPTTTGTGRIIGSDFAGIVVARGPLLPLTTTITTTHSASISRGDRVAGFLPGTACLVLDDEENDDMGTDNGGGGRSASAYSSKWGGGAFAEYVVCPADLIWRVPAHIPFEEAASVSLCGLAAAQGLYFRLGLAAPFQWDDESEEGVLRRVDSENAHLHGRNGGHHHGLLDDDDDDDDALPKKKKKEEEEEISFLVYGASTSLGMYVAQLVRRSAEVTGQPMKLIGVASPRHFERLAAEPYRYDHLFDYRDPHWPEKVRQAAGGTAASEGGVHYAYDAVSEASTVHNVKSTLRKKDGKMAVVRSEDVPPPAATAGQDADDPVMTRNLDVLYGTVWEGLGHDVDYRHSVVHSSPQKRAFASGFYKWLSDGGTLRPNPVRVMPGGLGKVVGDGLALLGSGLSGRRELNHGRLEEHMKPISGEKIVYTVETDRVGSAGEGHFK